MSSYNIRYNTQNSLKSHSYLFPQSSNQTLQTLQSNGPIASQGDQNSLIDEQQFRDFDQLYHQHQHANVVNNRYSQHGNALQQNQNVINNVQSLGNYRRSLSSHLSTYQQQNTQQQINYFNRESECIFDTEQTQNFQTQQTENNYESNKQFNNIRLSSYYNSNKNIPTINSIENNPNNQQHNQQQQILSNNNFKSNNSNNKENQYNNYIQQYQQQLNTKNKYQDSQKPLMPTGDYMSNKNNLSNYNSTNQQQKQPQQQQQSNSVPSSSNTLQQQQYDTNRDPTEVPNEYEEVLYRKPSANNIVTIDIQKHITDIQQKNTNSNIQGIKNNILYYNTEHEQIHEADEDQEQESIGNFKQAMTLQSENSFIYNNNNKSKQQSSSNSFVQKKNKKKHHHVNKPKRSHSTRISVQELLQSSSFSQMNESRSRLETMSMIENQQKKLYERMDLKNQKLEKLKKQARDKEMEECTFSPKINGKNNHKKKFMSFTRTNSSLDFSSFLEGQEKFMKSRDFKNEQRKQLIQNINEKENTHKPQVNDKKNKKLAKSKEPVHIRLYSISKSQERLSINPGQKLKTSEQLEEEAHSFAPKICRKSVEITKQHQQHNRTCSDVGARLYTVAMERDISLENKRKNSLIQVKANQSQSFINKNSDQLIAKKLYSEFCQAWDHVLGNIENDQNNIDNNFQKIDYINFNEILSLLQFCNSNQQEFDPQQRALVYALWKILGGDIQNGVQRQNLLKGLFIISGLQNQQKLLYGKNNSRKNSENYYINEEFMLTFSNNPYQKDENQQNIDQQIYDTNQNYQMNFSQEQYQNNKKNLYNNQFKIGYFSQQDGTLILNQKQENQLAQKFEVLKRHRILNQKTNIQLKSEFNKEFMKQQSSMLNKPYISKKSETLAHEYRKRLQSTIELNGFIDKSQLPQQQKNQYQNNKNQPKMHRQNSMLNHSDMLTLQKQIQKEKIKEKKQILEQEELRECTFQPNQGHMNRSKSISSLPQNRLQTDPFIDYSSNMNKTNETILQEKCNNLYNQAKSISMKRDKSSKDVEYEKGCDQCTFQPNLAKNYNENVGPSKIYAKNIDKFINRIRNTRKETDAKNQMHKRGYHEVTNFNSLKQLQKASFSQSQYKQSLMQQQQSSIQLKQNDIIHCESSQSLNKKYNQQSMSYTTSNNSMVNTSTNSMNNSYNFKKKKSVTSIPQQQQHQQHQQQQQYNNYNQQQQQQQQQYQQQNPEPKYLSEIKKQEQENYKSISDNKNMIQPINHNSDSYNNNIVYQNIYQQQFQQNQQKQQLQQQQKQMEYISREQQEELLEQPSQEDEISNQYRYQEQFQEAQKQSTVYSSIKSQSELQQQIQQSQLQQTQQKQQNISNLDHPFSNSASIQYESEKPLLHVDVNFGNGKTQRIMIFQGQDLEKTSEEFAKTHGLDRNVQQKLNVLLHQELHVAITKSMNKL